LRSEELRREMEKEHTFNPNVASSQRGSPTDPPLSPSKGAVFQRLSASRQYVHEVLNQVKTEFELDNCTFHPEINRVSDDLAVKKYSEPVHLRLTAQATRHHDQTLKLQAKKQEDELIDCTFSPVISKSYSHLKKNSQESVFQRLSSGASWSSSGSPTPVQENLPENVPKVIRRPVGEVAARAKDTKRADISMTENPMSLDTSTVSLDIFTNLKVILLLIKHAV
jgi:hypothetical protein